MFSQEARVLQTSVDTSWCVTKITFRNLNVALSSISGEMLFHTVGEMSAFCEELSVNSVVNSAHW